MNPMLNIAITAARSAGETITRYLDRIDRLTVTSKAVNDFVTEVDRRAEEAIIRIIRKSYPDHAVLAEESGQQSGNEFEWIIDPLDGTTNFLHGLPHYGVSIACRHNNKLEVGVIYDPSRQELFTASRGQGAQLNDHRIRVSKCKELGSAILGTGFPFRQHQHINAYVAGFKSMLSNSSDLRRAGSASLDLAYVASGRLDGFWEIGLNEWDIAAGVLLVLEAGGLVGDFSGGHEFMETGNIICGNPKIFKNILQTLQPHLTPALKK